MIARKVLSRIFIRCTFAKHILRITWDILTNGTNHSFQFHMTKSSIVSRKMFNRAASEGRMSTVPAVMMMMMTAHQGQSVDPRLIQNNQRKEMTHTSIYKSASEIDSGLTDSVFIFRLFFFSFPILSSLL